MFLFGYGYFNSYLCKIGKAQSAKCLYGDSLDYDACHTFFASDRWQLETNILEENTAIPNSIIGEMIGSEECLQLAFVYNIFQQKIKNYVAATLTNNEFQYRR